MNYKTRLLLAVAVGCFGSSQPALAEDRDCDKLSVPKNIEGQVIKIDPVQGKISVHTTDGTTHEFQASKETLQDYKTGDTLKATLRTPPKCQPK